MTPREWFLLASDLDERGMPWEWVNNGNAIGVLGDRVWISIQVNQGKWIAEVEDRVKVGGYYDPPEYRYSHDYVTDNAEDVADYIDSIIREA
jgi:hypothetical protein